jgi:hypothetical protein
LKRRRGWFWTAVVLAAAAVLGGSVIAYRAYRQTASASGAVRGYFAALQRGDAAAALGFGDVPNGPHELLTGAVLRMQQSIAPIRSVHVQRTRTGGDRGSVRVQYTIDFPGTPQVVTNDVAVVRRSGVWRLAKSAVDTELLLPSAGDRADVLGRVVPKGEVLAFPGAAPVQFDTPYLELDPTEDYVSFDTGASLSVLTRLSDSGRRAVDAALSDALRHCLTDANPDPRCPLPNDDFVPGSVHGALPSDLGSRMTVDLRAQPAGLIDIIGSVNVRARWTRLTFANVAVAGRGSLSLSITATAYPVPPIRIDWVQT